MIYKPVKGSQLNQEQAQKYGEYISILEEEHGGVGVSLIVQDAAKKRSPLHEYFEWDDKVAAGNYRIEQARHLLKNINVVVKTNGDEQEVRAFHAIKPKVLEAKEQPTNGKAYQPPGQEHRFISVQRAMSDKEMATEVVQNALRELVAWKRKYSLYKQLAKVTQAVNKAIEMMKVE